MNGSETRKSDHKDHEGRTQKLTKIQARKIP